MVGKDVRLINSFLASNDLSHWLITFNNSLDPDKNQQNVGHFDPNRLAHEFCTSKSKINFEKGTSIIQTQT